ncbi:unnamed protein product [Urochloa humidicola]
MEAVSGALGSLIPKLGKLLKQEYSLQKRVRRQVEYLSQELDCMHAALRKVADVPPDQLDELVKLWASQVKELSYDMEDIIDTFLVRVEGGRAAHTSTGVFIAGIKKMTKLIKTGKARREISNAINDIKEQVQEVANRRARHRIDDIVSKPANTWATIDPRLSALYTKRAQLVGIEEPMDGLIKMLLEGDAESSFKRMKKVCIVGSGGLGKTTLAKVVYDELKDGFTCGAFVPVGRNPDLRKVFGDILIGLDRKYYTTIFNTRTMDERQLIDEIKEFLKNKRFLIVIDDIWETQSWEIINLALDESNCGSISIATTRKFEVAIEIGEVYRQEPLSDANSKKLFYTRIFGSEGKCLGHHQHDEVSNIILKKCGGVPLAIVTMASLLVGKPLEKWYEMSGSIGFGHEDNRHTASTMRILSFSYYEMPSHLRSCLLYLGAFPEDHFIEKYTLIWKWIAEGFVYEEQGIGLFEVGEGYFNELINRSMILPAKYEIDGETIETGCRVHDMVLDLIRSISSDENFLTILDDGFLTILDAGNEELSQSSRARRVAVHKTMLYFKVTTDVTQVRSFIGTRCYSINNMPPISSFRLLRVLAIENCSAFRNNHLKHLGNLIHLRYLGLSGTRILELPKEIGALKFLQTLLLDGTGIEKLPWAIGLLAQLVCLRADERTRMPYGVIGKLISLEELWIHYQVVARDKFARWFVKELGNLKKLRVLRASISVLNEGMQRDLMESLCNLTKIHHLQIRSMHINGSVTLKVLRRLIWINENVAWEFILPRHIRHLEVSSITFSRLPACINPSLLPYLSYLHLMVHPIDERDLKVLGSLPELNFLRLVTFSTVTGCDIAGDGYFKKLRFCSMPCSMVQFLPNNKENIICFHVWNGFGSMPFVASKQDDSSRVFTFMPNLEVLEFLVSWRALKKDGNCTCDNLGIEILPSLLKVIVEIDCSNASASEVEEAEATLRRVTGVHPNHPTLKVTRKHEDGIILSASAQVANVKLSTEEQGQEEQILH